MEKKESTLLIIKNLEESRNVILEKYKKNLSLCFRFSAVFTQLINLLNRNGGNAIEKNASLFERSPLTKIFGKSITVEKNRKISLEALAPNDSELELFRDKIQLIYDSFLERETTELLNSLTEIEIRGVAKIAGIENFDKAPIAGSFVEMIKQSIRAKLECEKKQEEELKNLNAAVVSDPETTKLECDKKRNNTKK